MARVELATGRSDAARKRLAAQIAREPLLPEPHVVMAETLLPGDPAGAEKELRAALKFNPSHKVARNALLAILQHDKRWPEFCAELAAPPPALPGADILADAKRECAQPDGVKAGIR